MVEHVRVVVRVRPVLPGSPSRRGRRKEGEEERAEEQTVVNADGPERIGYQISETQRQVGTRVQRGLRGCAKLSL